MTRRHPESRAGVALVELTIALAIAIATFGSIFLVAAHALRAVRDARGDALALRVADAELERLRALAYGGVTALGAGYPLDAGRVPELAALKAAEGAVRIAPDADGGVRVVSVRLSWQGCSGRGRSLALSTLIGPRAGEEAHEHSP